MVDVDGVKDVLGTYKMLSRAGKKEFWGRIVSKIIITNEDDFSIVPHSP